MEIILSLVMKPSCHLLRLIACTHLNDRSCSAHLVMKRCHEVPDKTVSANPGKSHPKMKDSSITMKAIKRGSESDEGGEFLQTIHRFIVWHLPAYSHIEAKQTLRDPDVSHAHPLSAHFQEIMETTPPPAKPRSCFSGDSNFSVFRVQQLTEWPGPLH